jgi:hypothetical protein
MPVKQRAGPFVLLLIVSLCVGGIVVPQPCGAEPPAKPDPKSKEEKERDEAAAERPAERWIQLLLTKDVAGLVKMADVPFYTQPNEKVIVLKTRKELEADLVAIKDQQFPDDLTVKITGVTTYAGGKKSSMEQPRKGLDSLLRRDERLAWFEVSGTGPIGADKFDYKQALIFEVPGKEAKWIGRLE